MKKLLKATMFISAVVGGTYLINDFIFKNVNNKIKNMNKHLTYEWKFGNINYIKAGSGKPLLLVHNVSNGSSLLEWEKSMAILARKYTVYAIDLLGFGYSDKPAISYSGYLYTSLIKDFLEEVICEPAFVVGSGVSCGFVAGASNIDCVLFKKIILINPIINNKSNQMQNSIIRLLLDLPIKGTAIYNLLNSKFMIRRFLENNCFSNEFEVSNDLVNQYYNSAHFGNSNARYPIAALYANDLNVNLVEILNKIEVPFHIILGEENMMQQKNDYNSFEEKLEDISLSIFEDTKLLPHVENNKGFCKECITFFKKELSNIDL